VIISAQAQDGRLRLVVSDTGRGFGETVGAGVGLENIRERLAALYGETARLTLESNSPSGVIATIEVPLDGMRPQAVHPGAEAAPAQPQTKAGKVLSAVARRNVPGERPFPSRSLPWWSWRPSSPASVSSA